MNDDSGFIQAIQADPDDNATRLIYADWLDEREDIRGPYLRLEQQLAEIPQRLAKLREQIDPSWLLAVSRRRKVVLVSFVPEMKIMCIHIVRANRDMGLKECKDLVESAPCTIKDDLTLEEAEQLAQQFEGYATVSIQPASR